MYVFAKEWLDLGGNFETHFVRYIAEDNSPASAESIAQVWVSLFAEILHIDSRMRKLSERSGRE
jgi:hypothetical protein